jgi:hypothetical protein
MLEKVKAAWQAEESAFGKFLHKYVSIGILICGAIPEVLIWAGTLPQGVVPQGFWTFGLIAGAIAKAAGKLTLNKPQ